MKSTRTKALIIVFVSILSIGISKSIVGGPREIDPEDPQVLDAAKHGVMLLNQKLDGTKAMVLNHVVKATTQVVAGIKYNLIVEVAESDCPNRKGLVPEDNQCRPQDGTPKTTYELQIWWQSWRTPAYQLMGQELLSSGES